MADLNIRNISPELKQDIKIAAAKRGQTLREYCIKVLGQVTRAHMHDPPLNVPYGFGVSRQETPLDMANRLIGAGVAIPCSDPKRITYSDVMEEVARRKKL